MTRSGERTPAPSRRGSALVLALLVVVMVGALGSAFLTISSATARRQTSEVENLQAFYLAEAGLAEAFQAIRIGRSGQIASQAEPAAFGDGLLWVDATETVDQQVRVRSTALHGSGRATLQLVVEPVDVPLGFFSDEDLVVDSVLLVDGFNSEEATYEEEVGKLPSVTFGPDDYVHDNVSVMVVRISEMYYDYAYREGDTFYYVDSVPRDPILRTIDARDYFDAKNADPSSSESPTAAAGHTDSGGLLGSNGNVNFGLPSGEAVDIYGDIVPGAEGTVNGVEDIFVSGDTDPRTAPVELPPVEVPALTLAPPVRHDDLLPLVVPPGASGHERIEVAADAELILRGPATIVIGTLVLEPGALLTLDTRDGDVELYVTGGMDLQPGSAVITTSDFPDELTVQVAPIPTGADGAPVKLEATSQFHGTIYAPETEVKIGSDFEVYGGVVARKLLIGPGARLHFDSADYEGSPIPRLVSWRIVELPTGVRGRGGDPYSLLGVERGTLAELSGAHDLASVVLTIEYIDHSGATQNYTGTEDLFDWTQVAEILKLERDATRPQEEPYTEPEPAPEPPLEPEPEPLRQEVMEWVDAYPMLMNEKDMVDGLIPLSPLSPEELAAVEAKGIGPGQYGRLMNYQ